MSAEISRIGGDVDSVLIFITAIGVFFFLLTQGFLIYFAWRYRRKKNEEERETPYIIGNFMLELLWIVVPSLLVLAIFWYGWTVYKDMRRTPPGATEISVVGKQWFFQFKYPDGRLEVNEVRVPVGKPVKFVMTSTDVIHSFFLPAFRIKEDMVPGRYSYLWVHPLKEGRYDIYCAEYCGAGHSVMRAVMVVLSEKDYQAWAGKEAAAGAEPPAERGKALVERLGCLACHSVDGSPKPGPTFKGLYGRQVVLADGSSVSADENYIRESIEDPNAKLVKGFPAIMPTFKGVAKDEDIAAMIAYLKTLK